MNVTVLVLGAAGRVGRELVAQLPGFGYRVVGVARGPRPADVPTSVEWLRHDLRHGPSQVIDELIEQWSGQIAVVDLVLDRVTTRAMQESISAATDFTLTATNRMKARGLDGRILSASTTAVLAPPGLRTPYSRAKRMQALRYARHSNADIVLLPQLSADGPATHAWAADVLAGVLTMHSLPAGPRIWGPPETGWLPGERTTTARFLCSHAASIRHRHDPAARRRATHARLAALPKPARDRLDHHRTPAWLLRRFHEQVGASATCPIPEPGQRREGDGHETR